MRGVVVGTLAALALVASGSLHAGTAATTTLRISYWDNGVLTAQPDSVQTLRCAPARGTLPQPARACARLAAGGAKLVAPVPERAICTEIWGGPQRARVIGKIAGKRVWVTFGRTNGCHISRWDKLSPWLLPAGGVTR
jgi:hypothetical protein